MVNGIFLAVMLTSLAACSDSKATKIKGDFLAGCVQSGASKAICFCVYEKIEKKYTTQDLLELENTQNTAVKKEFMAHAIESTRLCRDQ